MRKFELRSIDGEIDVVMEVNGMDNIDIDIEDSEGKIEDMADFICKALPKDMGLRWTRLRRQGCFPITLRFLCITLKLCTRILHHIGLMSLP